MRFPLNGTTVTLRGNPSLSRSQTLLKAMFRVIRKERMGVLIEMNQMEEKEATGGGNTHCPRIFEGSNLGICSGFPDSGGAATFNGVRTCYLAQRGQ